MQIQDVKIWQWMLIGLVIGAAVGFAWTGSEVENQRNVGRQVFMANVRAPAAAVEGEMKYSNIVVYPPTEGAYNRPVQVVTYEELFVDRETGRPVRVPGMLRAEIPFRASLTNSVSDYLRQLNQRSERLPFRVATESDQAVIDPAARSMPSEAFWRLLEKLRNNETVNITDVVVHPGRRDDRLGNVTPVSFKLDGKPYVSMTTTPFVVDTVLDYLAEMKQREPRIEYRYAFEREPGVTVGIGAGIGFLLVGVVWPLVLGRLVAAGLGPPKKEKKPSLRHYKPKPEDNDLPEMEGRKVVTAEDRAQLEEYTKTLEESVGHAPTTVGSAASQDRHDTPIRKLDGGPLEQAAIPETEEEEKEYVGEWYPVARPHKKHGEEDERHHPKH